MFYNVPADFYEVDVISVGTRSSIILHTIDGFLDIVQSDNLSQHIIVIILHRSRNNVKELNVFSDRLGGEQVTEMPERFRFNVLEVVDNPVVSLDLEHTVKIFPSLSLLVEEVGVPITILKPFAS